MNIWVPSTKIIEPDRELSLPVHFEGRYVMEAVRPDGRRRPLASFKNLILNAGLDRIAANTDWIQACQVGTGTNAAANGDTALQTWLAGTTTQNADNLSVQSSAPYYSERARTFRFSQGAAAGNLTEVGIGWAVNAGSFLFSRARIVDGSNNPTTVTVLSDEFLDVTYIFRSYVNPSDITGTVAITGVGSIDYTIRAAQANATTYNNPPTSAVAIAGGGVVAYDGAIGSITSFPSGNSSTATTNVGQSYTNGTYYRDLLTTFGLTQGNFPGAGGIKSVLVPLQLGGFQIEFATRINKTSSQTLALTFRNAWARKASP